MLRRKLTWQILGGFLAILVGTLTVASWYTSTVFRKYFIDQTIAMEKNNTYLVTQQIAPLLGDTTARMEVNRLCKQLGRDIGMRITVILTDGTVIGDSHRDPSTMENHLYRPEIVSALEGNTGVADRTSATLNIKMLYVAAPVIINDRTIAVVRTSVELSSISAALHRYYDKIALIAAIMAAVAVLLSFFFARRIIVPIQELKSGAERFALGDFVTRVTVPQVDELRHLGDALNKMASQLDDRIKTVTTQRNEQQAILSSMVEAVIAVDSGERILSVNGAAAAMFGFDISTATGKLLGEIIRNSALQTFVQQFLASKNAAVSMESDITVPKSIDQRDHDRHLQLHGTALRGAGDVCIGALVVASDVTRLRQLETMRKEFVANVSHELRTPLTTIKGFVETLAQGALDNRADAARFLTIIQEQVDRLNGLIEDLLALAVIEREEETQALGFSVQPLLDTVKSAVQSYQTAAAAKSIALFVSGEPFNAEMNRPLMEQAIGNLIDNAIKYSEPGHDVSVTVSREGESAIVAVQDHGIGIAPEHLDRLFERFYRVDKARSRKLGGTGLGLSIVKHIVSSHNGTISVESRVGEGTVFNLKIPVKAKGFDPLHDRGDSRL
jgi:two-component system phosphate regulon sensor histidine kinase PhoR